MKIVKTKNKHTNQIGELRIRSMKTFLATFQNGKVKEQLIGSKPRTVQRWLARKGWEPIKE